MKRSETVKPPPSELFRLAKREVAAFLGRECGLQAKAASTHEKNGVRYRVKRSGAVKPPPFISFVLFANSKKRVGGVLRPPHSVTCDK